MLSNNPYKVISLMIEARVSFDLCYFSKVIDSTKISVII